MESAMMNGRYGRRPAVHDFEMELRHDAQEVGGVSSKT
jgi:hypothetical protein